MHLTLLSGGVCAVALMLAAGSVEAQEARPAICDVTAYGAVADDETLDDAGIAAAIAACAPSGGTVILPRGVFLTGGVQLASNITFHLNGGAVLKGSSDLSDYTPLLGLGGAELERTEGDTNRGVLSAVGVENVTLSGTGVIDGTGAAFWSDLVNRPDFAVGFADCRNVRMRDVTVIDPAKYNIRFNNCDNVVVDGVTVNAPMLSPNSDGIQIRDSADVRISNCQISTGDDAIVLKAHERNVERVTVTNCRITSDDAAFKFGTGSETVTRDVTVSNVVVTGSRYGVALFMQDGGTYENARFTDMIIETGGRHRREYPIYVDIDTRFGDGAFGTIHNITFDGLDIRTRGNILIGGQEAAPVTGVTLSNIRMTVADAVDLAATAGKPRGNRLQAQRTGAADFSGEVGHIVLGNTVGAAVRDVTIMGATEADRRPVLVARGSTGLTADGDFSAPR
ncbi:glycoside hydrolase family 28 protein [Brevundimonas bacteroides]|uniref:glycoside hydrolase family 28 protein n=1 Tax=Brevundimonas bacteroides TaxID=74311 RepID=UPI0004968DA1|nr:glycosyl hydrolase family 28 protein [Brevundimonas bacteroides]